MTLKQLRQMLVVILASLLAVGTIAVFSASAMVSSAMYGGSLHFLKQHLLAIVLGLATALGCLMLPHQSIRRLAPWLLVAALVLLALVFVLGPEVGGARRWFRIGRFSVQPSEFAQLALVLYLADLLARKAEVIREFRRGLMPPLVITGLAAGMCLLQPDLGTAVVMGAVALLLLAVANARWQHLAGIGLVACAGFVVLVLTAEYRMRRIMAFLDPWQDPQGVGYQIIQSYCALANGGLFGLGVGNSVQKLFYLPSAHTDFIFAIIGEELGLIGTSAVIVLFMLFLVCGFRLAMACESLYGKYLICGLVGMLGLEAMVNIGVVIGAFPTKGLPLPFVSYGGSSMVMNLLAGALMLQASRSGEQVAEGLPWRRR